VPSPSAGPGPKPPLLRSTPAAAVLALGLGLAPVAATGCGGAHRAERPTGGARAVRSGPAAGEEADRASATRSVPAADRVAYYQLAVAAGFLRASAGGAQGGRAPSDRASSQRARSQLDAAAQRLGELAPRDPGLRVAAERLRAAIGEWLDAPRRGPGARRADLRAQRATTRALVAVRAFLRRHRALAGAIPD